MTAVVPLLLVLLSCADETAGEPDTVTDEAGDDSAAEGGDDGDDDSDDDSDDGGSDDTGTADSGPGDTATGPTDDTAGADTDDAIRDALITVTQPVDADLSCYVPGGTCLIMRAFEECVASRTLDGRVTDQSGAALTGAEVALYWQDDLSLEPDTVMSVGDDGALSEGRAPTCTPLSWSAVAGGAVTVGAHAILPPTDGEPTVAQLDAVSAGELQALYDGFGLTPDPGLGLITGTITDCSGRIITETQAVAVGDEGYAAGQSGHYFTGGAPDPARLATSEDGRWLLAGLAPGRYLVEIWGVTPGFDKPLVLSFSEIDVVAGGISIMAMQAGIAGAVFPDFCLDPCE